MEDNTEAVKANTKQMKTTQNSIYSNSALANYIQRGVGGPEGFGIGGKSDDAGYPWHITSNYGMRYHPTKHKYLMHNGVDFGAKRNTAIGAAMGMKVEDVISRLKGIDCGGRGTSCPDQLATALENM